MATMVQQGFEQQGKLAEHPLAELVRETSAAGLSGALRLTHERAKMVVYLDGGRVSYAISNLRTHRLAECARRWQLVEPEQLSRLSSRLNDAEAGQALLRVGALTEESLAELTSFQVSDVLRTALLWIEGEWSFDPRVRLTAEMQVRIPLRELLTECARRLPGEFIVRRFANTNELLSLEPEPPAEVVMQPVEAFVLSRLEAGQIRVHDLLSISGLPETETLRAVYALAFGGFIRREQWPQAFSETIVVRLLDATKKASERQQEQKQERTAAGTETEAARPAPVASKEPEVDERAELEQFFARLETAEDYYQVLGVAQTAEAGAIKQAYHRLARRFHPDRFHQEAGTPLHMRLQNSFARVAQAYDTLRDATTRSGYDLRLESQKKLRHQTSAGQTAGGGTGQMAAEESFKRGLAALKANNLTQAMSLLGEAARLAPKQPRYRAYYGLALSANRQMRHQAEAELQAAISLDANNASYRVMLAELYLTLGMQRRAQSELQRTLTLDPKNAEARRLLDDLSGKG